ncbi:MAG: formate dehydrogenase accessory sulfurtransferase FdhD [Verrucomicrobiae bacterium]|nr:formate dehydrogenase accessory sulfurtransferase FdhD [Verrucomicrobiae bacterium]
MDKLEKTSSIAENPIVRMEESGTVETVRDAIAVEEPLEIRLGNEPFVVTMRTPGHDEDLAIGFLVTEGILQSLADIRKISRCSTSPTPQNTVRIDLAGKLKDAGLKSNRLGAIAASCGVCGKTSIDWVRQKFPRVESRIQVDRKLLLRLPDRLREAQAVFEKTGGLHSAGIFDLEGNLLCLREDVGRHNALDKVIGWAFRNRIWPLDKHILLVSGRVAFEIMQKALAAQVSIVAAVSAPSSLAISFALENGQTLVGFLRRPTLNIYSHPQRVI